MKKSEKDKIQELFFQFKEIYDNSPLIQKELITALRLENIISSNAIENHLIDPVLLQAVFYSGNVRTKEFSNPAYRKAFLEVKGHDRMFRFLQVKAASRAELSVSLLLKIHRILFEKSWPEIAGRFRDIDVRIRGVKFRPPHYTQIFELVYQHLSWVDGLLKLLGPVNPGNFFEIFHVAADLQSRIIRTYPFHAGNWRIARSLSDYIFLYSGMTYCIIDVDNRDKYLTAVGSSTISDSSSLEELLLQSYGETLNHLNRFIRLMKNTSRNGK